jgi:hypothetical protein
LTIYADSSFLVSGYVKDMHSAEVVQRMKGFPSVWITPLNRAELSHALSQYVFRSVFTDADARRYWNEFEDDCSKGVWVEVDMPEEAWETSVNLAQRFGPSLGVRTLVSRV